MLLQGNYKKIEPASGAIIMAGGIFLIGAIEAFPSLDDYLGALLAFVLLVSWIMIYWRLSVQFFHRDFFYGFMQDPVRSFTVGTWIAGVSVLCNVFLKYFPNLLWMTQVIAVFNTFLWFFFLVICIYHFRRLIMHTHDYPVDGVVLLSTVGMQSIIVLLSNVLFPLPVYASEGIILFGMLFYFIGVYVMGRRYIQTKWTIVEDWANTNCIIHGALSITGLAVVSANAFSSQFIMVLWGITLALLILVEAMEVIRAILRVKQLGWRKGIFTYHVSQWSRNFTFGMFFTFTFYMRENPLYHIHPFVSAFQSVFLLYWAWGVALLLVVQLALFIHHHLTGYLY